MLQLGLLLEGMGTLYATVEASERAALNKPLPRRKARDRTSHERSVCGEGHIISLHLPFSSFSTSETFRITTYILSFFMRLSSRVITSRRRDSTCRMDRVRAAKSDVEPDGFQRGLPGAVGG